MATQASKAAGNPKRSTRRPWPGQRVFWATAFVAAMALIASEAGADPPPASDSSGNPPASQLSQVTIQAQRLATEKRVHEFVARIPLLSNYESLARWNTPICPLVAGLPRVDGEFVLTRLSAIATSVGAPLAPEKCSPNFLIVVTSDPVALIKGWAKRAQYRHLFGDVGAGRINRFINTPKAIRVWYNEQSTGANGAVLTPNSPTLVLNISGIDVVESADDTRLEWNAVFSIESAIEVVDSGRMKGFKFGQLADYVTMAGLAEFNFAADLGTAPTVLRLFNAPGEAAPGGLSAWDEAFLKALYHVRQSSRLQTGLIMQSMVRDIDQ